MILPIVAIGLIFGVVFTFTDLSVVYLLTNGGPVGATSVLTLGVATDLIRERHFLLGRDHGRRIDPSIPVAIAYNSFLDRFIEGITGGAVK